MNPEKLNQAMLLGNEAIGRGLIEAGCHFVTSYPGTPSSEILPAVVKFKKQEQLNIYANWAVNEKIAFDEALAASYTGKRAAVIMKQVGLNVAADSLMSAAYTGVKGGFVIICADDPGPHSSQTEQDSRLFGHFAKIPVFDPASPLEAIEMLSVAFEISEKYETPVLLRPSLRICHARMNVPLSPIKEIERKAKFQKDPHRWAATPRYRFQLHRQLNEKLKNIQQDFEQISNLNYSISGKSDSDFGIIAAGISFAIVIDLLKEFDLEDHFSILKIGTPHPLPHKLIDEFINSHQQILVLEDPDFTIELQIREKSKIHGRLDGTVPSEGELSPEIIYQLLSNFSDEIPKPDDSNNWSVALNSLIDELNLPVRPPTLCPGCGHRAAFYAIRKAFPKAIYTSDIGCYTLGLNLKAVDTILDMGAGITIATGFYHAYNQDDENQPIIATMGDSTFFHSGLPSLVDAVYSDARYIFVLLDNGTTAMTGMQPTPALGILADGSQGNRVDPIDLIKACGVKFVKSIDAYQISGMIDLVKEAYDHTQKEDGGVAVIVAHHPCLIAYRNKLPESKGEVKINEDCNGCKHCVNRFECPALVYDKEKKLVSIDRKLCVDCGVCIEVCPQKAIYMEEK